MKTSTILREYIWIIETLRRDRLVPLKELSLQWQKNGLGDGQPLSRSTFTRYREAIYKIFGIEIACKRGTGFEYYIKNEDILEKDTIQAWMVTAFSVGHIISEELGLQHRIVLDNMPVNVDFLKTIFDAMHSNLCLNIEYQKYGSDEKKRYEIEPYCVKFFKNRWYLLGKYYVLSNDEEVFSPKEERLHIFCFDRIKSLTMSDRMFQVEPKFDAHKYFQTAFGAYIDSSTDPEPVVVRAYGMARYYLQDMPVHHSQHIINETPEYADFEVYIRPTVDFLHHILSQGDCLKIIEPSWVVDEMHTLVLDTLKLYDPSLCGSR